MRILVVGGNQTAAQRCVKELIAGGHDVTALCRNRGAADACRSAGAGVVMGSPLNLPPLDEALARKDAAVLFGTDMPEALVPSADELAPYDRIRRDGTRNFAAAALRQRTPLCVLVSSVIVYGDCGERWVNETTPLDPPAPAAAFRDMEDTLRQSGEFQGLQWVILRTGLVYSADAWHTRRMFASLAEGTVPPLAGEGGYVSPIHSEDLARAVVHAIERAPHGAVINVVDDSPVRLRDLVAEAARVAGARPPGALPSFMLRLSMGRDMYRLLKTSCRKSTCPR